MAYTKFDPRGNQGPEKPFIKRERESTFYVGLQLFLIFAVLRFVMLIMGMPFFRVPILDNILIQLILLMR